MLLPHPMRLIQLIVFHGILGKCTISPACRPEQCTGALQQSSWWKEIEICIVWRFVTKSVLNVVLQQCKKSYREGPRHETYSERGAHWHLLPSTLRCRDIFRFMGLKDVSFSRNLGCKTACVVCSEGHVFERQILHSP